MIFHITSLLRCLNRNAVVVSPGEKHGARTAGSSTNPVSKLAGSPVVAPFGAGGTRDSGPAVIVGKPPWIWDISPFVRYGQLTLVLYILG